MNIIGATAVVLCEFAVGTVVGYHIHKTKSEKEQKEIETRKTIAGITSGIEMVRRAMCDKATDVNSKIVLDKAFWPMMYDYNDSHPGEAIRHANDLYNEALR